jgi:3-oxoacyl-[acyl-carrier-protein] synthase-3
MPTFSQIAGIHYCLPNGRLTNEDLLQRFDAKLVQSIVKMSGIQERRVVLPGQTASDLGFVAADRLLNRAGVPRETVDALIFASQTGDYQIPATACALHERLGLSQQCAAFDINLGCTSYPYSLAVADGLIASGQARRILLINADALTTVIHPRDRGLVPLHGDGACATLIEPSDGRHGLIGSLLGTDGTGHRYLIIPASGARKPRTAETRREIVDETGSVRTEEHLMMNGPAVFHFSVYKVPEVIRAALDKFGFTVENMDLVLLHQANRTMLDLIYRSLKVPEGKRFYFHESIGNLSGASTPTLLAEAVRSGRVQPGSLTLLAAFGVGLSWGVSLIRWPETVPAMPDLPVDYPES